jgi:hypothetical protein
LPYSPTDYWQGLHERDGLSAVGQSALPDGINEWLYRSLARNLKGFLRNNHVRPPADGRLLDVGVGKGYWIPFWQRAGWRVDGCDLVPSAVAAQQQRYPDSRFWIADVSDKAALTRGGQLGPRGLLERPPPRHAGRSVRTEPRESG